MSKPAAVPKLTPKFDYVLCKTIKEQSGVVTQDNVTDTQQKYEVMAVNPISVGFFEMGHFVDMKAHVKPGALIYTEKHAEANTPPDLETAGYALILISRIMAVEDK